MIMKHLVLIVILLFLSDAAKRKYPFAYPLIDENIDNEIDTIVDEPAIATSFDDPLSSIAQDNYQPCDLSSRLDDYSETDKFFCFSDDDEPTSVPSDPTQFLSEASSHYNNNNIALSLPQSAAAANDNSSLGTVARAQLFEPHEASKVVQDKCGSQPEKDAGGGFLLNSTVSEQSKARSSTGTYFTIMKILYNGISDNCLQAKTEKLVILRSVMTSVHALANKSVGLTVEQLRKCPIHQRYVITPDLIQSLARFDLELHKKVIFPSCLLNIVVGAFVLTPLWKEEELAPLAAKWYYAFLSSIMTVSMLPINYDPQSDCIQRSCYEKKPKASTKPKSNNGSVRASKCYSTAKNIYNNIFDNDALLLRTADSEVNERFRNAFAVLVSTLRGVPKTDWRIHPIHQVYPINEEMLDKLSQLYKKEKNGQMPVPRQISGRCGNQSAAVQNMGIWLLSLAACIPNQSLGTLEFDLVTGNVTVPRVQTPKLSTQTSDTS